MPGDTGSILRKGGEGRDCIHRNGGDSGQHDHHHRLGDLGVGVDDQQPAAVPVPGGKPAGGRGGGVPQDQAGIPRLKRRQGAGKNLRPVVLCNTKWGVAACGWRRYWGYSA